jgi:hypothetical protein
MTCICGVAVDITADMPVATDEDFERDEART